MQSDLNEAQAKLSNSAIAEIVRRLDSPDWVQLELMARISPARRVLTGIRAAEFARAALRGTFRRRFPHLAQSELNLLVLRYLTPVRMGKNERT